jgi:hypothetical protein
MWNSNSLISWLIVRAVLDVDAVHPPAGGRAPGWDAGVILARRQETAPGVRQSPIVALNTLPRGFRERCCDNRPAAVRVSRDNSKAEYDWAEKRNGSG